MKLSRPSNSGGVSWRTVGWASAFTLSASFAVFYLYYIILKFFIPSLQNRGVFGDSFGAINAFFTAIAFIGVAVAIYYQHKEIQAKEEADRQERKRSRRIAKLQGSMVEAQGRQAEMLLETARLIGTGLLVASYREAIKVSDPNATEFVKLRLRHENSLLTLRMLMHKHWRDLDSRWKPFMRAIIREDLSRVDGYVEFSDKSLETGVLAEEVWKSPIFDIESTMQYILDRCVIMKTHVDKTADPDLHKALKDFIHAWMQRRAENVPMDNSWPKFVKSSLEAIEAALGD